MRMHDTTRVTIFMVAVAVLAGGARADWKESTPVGPGVVHHHEFRSAGPWHFHVLEIDLTNPWVSIESIKSNDLLPGGRELTSAMAARNDREAHRVVGAMNADFWQTDGTPVGAQVVKGVLVKRPVSRSVFAYTDQRRPLIDVVSFTGTLVAKGQQQVIHGVNESRDTDELIVYNSFRGSTTGTNYWGTEVVAQYLSLSCAVNDTVWLVATAKDSVMAAGHGNAPIPRNGVVLSGHGQAAAFLNAHVFVGDTVAVVLRLPPTRQRIIELVGGVPRIIRNGAVSVEWSEEGLTNRSFATDRHPRTAVGFSADSTRLFFVTVDGRQAGYSVGMSLYELAEYMREWGIHEAVNLDGGGSTTMVVRGRVVNSPSDGSERPVANALLVVSSAPTGPLHLLRISPPEAFLLSEGTLRFTVEGFDEYYNPVSLPAGTVNWSCDPWIGAIDAQGQFVAGLYDTVGYVYASAGGVRDSARVHITRVAQITLTPNPVVLRVGQKQTMTPRATDSFGNPVSLQASDYQWSVVGDVGTITQGGVFTATKQGEGEIRAAYGSVVGTAHVYVGLPTDVIVEDFSSLARWNLTGVRVNLPACSLALDSAVAFSPPTSARLSYQLSTGGTSALYMECSIPLSGTPIAVGIHVFGDGKGHWLRGEFTDADGEKFLVNFTEATPGIDWAGTWRYLRVFMDSVIVHWGNPAAVLTFPITWKRIYLAETNDSRKDSGVLYFDDFTAHYLETAVEPPRGGALPQSFRLYQNFPNPFNPSTEICFDVPREGRVRLEVINPLGARVCTLLDQQLAPGQHRVCFDGSNLAGGVYLYRLIGAGEMQNRKMILIR
ncbi:MAG: phosphodiester glycosidase family protein [candidate division KSB1 bacterium]|nr:phosphodiester glycosidase family protein [candidate division KSB1 bacterium]